LLSFLRARKSDDQRVLKVISLAAIANQFSHYSSKITEGSSVACAKRKSLIKRELKKVIINCVMLQIPNKICFQFSFPIHLAFVVVAAAVAFFLFLSLTLHYFTVFYFSLFFFRRMLRGEKAEKRQPEN
jgi:hypothetical protein